MKHSRPTPHLPRPIRLTLLLSLLCLLLSLVACSPEDIIPENDLDDAAAAILDAVLADDLDAACALMTKTLSRESVAEGFAEIRTVMEGATEYELTSIGWNVNLTSGITQNTLTLLAETDAGDFNVQISERSDLTDGIAWFHVSPTVTYTGGLLTLKGASPLQWAILLSSFVLIAFLVWMAVDCARRRMKHKALWILLILLANLGWSLSLSAGSFNLNWSWDLFLPLCSLITSSAGGFELQLSFPVGALIYLLLRSKLTLPPPAQEEPAEPSVDLGE